MRFRHFSSRGIIYFCLVNNYLRSLENTTCISPVHCYKLAWPHWPGILQSAFAFARCLCVDFYDHVLAELLTARIPSSATNCSLLITQTYRLSLQSTITRNHNILQPLSFQLQSTYMTGLPRKSALLLDKRKTLSLSDESVYVDIYNTYEGRYTEGRAGRPRPFWLRCMIHNTSGHDR